MNNIEDYRKQDETEDFEMLNDYEMFDLLDTVSDEVLLISIDDQINNTLENSRVNNNLLEYFNDRFTLLKHKYSENQDFNALLDEELLKFYNMILSKIESKFDISMNYNVHSNINLEEYIRNIKTLYELLILNHIELIKDFFQTYIYQNRKEIANTYRDSTSKKDLEFTSLRKYLKEVDDVITVVNVNNYIETFIDMNTDPDLVMKTIINSDPEELNRYILNNILYEENTTDSSLGSNFTKLFFKPIIENQYLIVPEIKNYFISTLPSNI